MHIIVTALALASAGLHIGNHTAVRLTTAAQALRTEAICIVDAALANFTSEILFNALRIAVRSISAEVTSRTVSVLLTATGVEADIRHLIATLKSSDSLAHF